MSIVRHWVEEIRANGVQMCAVCGEIIIDYRNDVTPKPDIPLAFEGEPKLSGFPQGFVYKSEGNPSYSSVVSPEGCFRECEPTEGRHTILSQSDEVKEEEEDRCEALETMHSLAQFRHRFAANVEEE